jgi:hypothetical protein
MRYSITANAPFVNDYLLNLDRINKECPKEYKYDSYFSTDGVSICLRYIWVGEAEKKERRLANLSKGRVELGKRKMELSREDFAAHKKQKKENDEQKRKKAAKEAAKVA